MLGDKYSLKPSDPASPLVTYPELAEHGVPFTRKHLLVLQRRGLFPKAIELSPNRIAWRLSDILTWRANCPVARSVREHSDEAA
jgi:predicted DNA-binding transcriptional regulator AlpA